jgi:hypothetical protein
MTDQTDRDKLLVIIADDPGTPVTCEICGAVDAAETMHVSVWGVLCDGCWDLFGFRQAVTDA